MKDVNFEKIRTNLNGRRRSEKSTPKGKQHQPGPVWQDLTEMAGRKLIRCGRDNEIERVFRFSAGTKNNPDSVNRSGKTAIAGDA